MASNSRHWVLSYIANQCQLDVVEWVFPARLIGNSCVRISSRPTFFPSARILSALFRQNSTVAQEESSPLSHGTSDTQSRRYLDIHLHVQSIESDMDSIQSGGRTSKTQPRTDRTRTYRLVIIILQQYFTSHSQSLPLSSSSFSAFFTFS